MLLTHMELNGDFALNLAVNFFVDFLQSCGRKVARKINDRFVSSPLFIRDIALAALGSGYCFISYIILLSVILLIEQLRCPIEYVCNIDMLRTCIFALLFPVGRLKSYASFIPVTDISPQKPSASFRSGFR